MVAKHPRAPGPSVKYDLLSAIAVCALYDGAIRKALGPKLLALITTRFDWSTGLISAGHDQLAALWNIDKRAVKRTLQELKDLEILLVLKRGVRGNVTLYRLDIWKALSLTKPVWPHLGEDFKRRLEEISQNHSSAATPKIVSLAGRREENAQTEEITDPLLKSLAREVHGVTFDRWFRRPQLARTKDKIVFEYDTVFMADYVMKEYGEVLARLAAEIEGRAVVIRAATRELRASI